MADSNKTEKPTPHRRDKARKQGQVARSRDLSSGLGLAGAGAVLLWLGHESVARWGDLLRRSLNVGASGQLTSTSPLLLWSSVEVLRAMLPVLSASLVLAVAGGVMQGGMVFAGEALAPKFERLSPAKKLQQMFSMTGLSGLLKSLLPFAAILFVGVQALRSHWADLVGSCFLSLHAFLALLLAMVLDVSWKSALVLLAWSGIDYFLTWQKMESDLRMTRQEIRDDFKETEGSPETKARIRR